MNKEQFARTANERYQKAREFWRNWRTQARDDYAFISGDQWLSEDEAILVEEKRPPITFNYSEKMVDAVLGAEVSNRQETTFRPRGMEDSPLAELWNAAAKYVREECGAEDEESDAFRDMLTCGMGWTWTRLSFEEDLDGKILIERIDPLEMFPDPAATKQGLGDRRWQDRLWWVDERDVKKKWPNAVFSEDGEGNTASGVVRHGQGYNDADDSREDDKDRHKGQVQLRLHETYELEDVYRVAAGQEVVELSPSDFEKLNAQQPLPEGSYVKQKKRVYYRAFFAGETLLEVVKSPCQENFCFQAITGKRDRNRNTWYGLTRVMKDPQRWANKWLSQILHIINSNAKGGLMAEVGAFVDPVRAKEEWAKPDSITLFREGALSGKKVQQKQVVTYPAGLDKLMEFALGSLPMVTGINLEALGLANREQAGVLEAQRKQAAYGLLSPLFDAIRRYRKTQGKVLLYYIRNYISDGRLVRIGGEAGEFLPLTKAPDAAKFDIIVDQSPNSPDTKEKTWQSLVELIPAMLKAGIPIPPDLLDYTPLPQGLIQKWKQFIGQQQQADQKLQEEVEGLQEENMQLKNDQQVKMQELEMKRHIAEQEMEMDRIRMANEIQMEREKHQQKMMLEREKAQASFELETFRQDREFELEGRRAEHESKMQQQKVDNEFRVKAFAEGMSEEGSDMPASERKVSIGIDTSSFAKTMEELVGAQKEQGDMMAQAIMQLAKSLSAPRRLVTDEQGRPVGSAPVTMQ